MNPLPEESFHAIVVSIECRSVKMEGSRGILGKILGGQVFWPSSAQGSFLRPLLPEGRGYDENNP